MVGVAHRRESASDSARGRSEQGPATGIKGPAARIILEPVTPWPEVAAEDTVPSTPSPLAAR